MKKKYFGIVLMVVGVAAIMWGYNIYDSATSEVTRAITGDSPAEAWAGMVGGAICFLIGALKVR
ncbi:DUF3185 family protein [Microbulbifer yueqingensis]|uniref:DUF3185 family protein n=1 Tax=Microbulbifer yueqingensis TaxID=658219 RepID=A0A1G8XD89_9GAMM|nr:DUF3185 family protein [Microbulbifer yueqingensis]SDJ88568.1 Protein of unknown function [Microbulbifer yueqingensis]